MKHLIIYAHPNPNSLNSYFKDVVVDALQRGEHEVQLRDLNQLRFNPVLSLADMNGQRMGQVTQEVKQEQELIAWAEHLTFIYPIWWTGMPAILKGYIDRVFSYGFAYRYDQGLQKGLLIGKKTTIINSHGKSNAEYEAIGMDKALLLTSDKGIYSYCGLEIVQHFFFDQADRTTPENVAAWTKTILQAYAK
ncbi:NAD(P)H-dependent oxidoreductase [Pedobacter sp. UC225_65]|uniref:NAD(P)H-dependent oxidoreductase n=1 Tax=Pedobacter sp. UC225_65 TaxID=3350173 RepID=UPI0036734B09